MTDKGKDCGNHGDEKRHKLYRQLFAGFLLVAIIALLIVLIVWLILRPTKPRFSLQDVSLLQFNLTSADGGGAAASLLTSVLQITISSRNPNDRIGVYYDRLDAYVLYQGQQITASTALPPGYQGHDDATVWSPYLYGVAIPLSPFLAVSIAQDEASGYLLLHIRIDGRLRWKVGSWISGHYHLQAKCPAFLTATGLGNSGGVGSPPDFRFQQETACSVDI